MAIGFATLAVAGMAQMSGTSAAFTDTATAASSFSTSNSFYPTPLVQNINCGTSYDWGLAKTVANISWNAPTPAPLAGQSYTYRVTIVQDSNNSNVVHDATQTGRSYTFVNNGTVKGKGWYVRVFTVNGPSMSSGWQSQGVNMAGGGFTASCTGNNDGQPNANGLNRSAPLAEEALKVPAEQAVTGTATTPSSPVTTTTESGTTSATTSTSSTKPGTASESPTASTTTTTTDSTTSTSNPPSPRTTTTTPATTSVKTVGLPVTLTGGAGTAQLIDDSGRKVLIDKDGAEVCRVDVEANEELASRGGDLWLTGGPVDRKVDTDTCAIT
ncbi:hypothetical protein ACFTSD_08055 [Nocardiaceae bacterium NPDC056970]